MSDTIDIPDTFDVLVLCGTRFFIDRATRREIENWLTGDHTPYDQLTVDDLTGSEVLILADAINSIYFSSPVTRAMDRAIDKAIDSEVQI
jgi:hypothetical protein